MLKRSFAILVFGVFINSSFAQLTVSTGQTPAWLVENVLLSGGVEISNVTYSGHADAIGYFQTGVNPTNLGMSEGIIMSTGRVNGNPSIGSHANLQASTSFGLPGYHLLTAIAGVQTRDAAILEFDFVPLSDTIEFRYVFASEEYHNYVNQINDVFAFFVTGPNPFGGEYLNQNIALLPGTSIPVSINNVNNGRTSNPCASGPCNNCEFFVDNCNGTSIVFNAFTVVLTARAVVVPCETYHLKIAIADAVDFIFDSAVFLEARSLSTNALTINIEHTIGGENNYAVQGCSEAIITFSIPEPATEDFIINYEIEGSAINGVDYEEIPDFITIPAGMTSATLVIDPIYQEGLQGTKEVKLIYSNLCLVADTIVVEIIDYIPPTATSFGEDAFCQSNAFDVQIGVSVADGHEPYSYTWDNDAGTVASPLVSPSTTTTYNVLVTDVCGFETNASVTIMVLPDPIISIVADPPEICSGSSAILTANGAVSYLWTGGGVSSDANPLIVGPDETTIYTVVGTDGNNCIAEATVTIPVNLTPQVTFYQLDPVCQNSSPFQLAGGNPTGGTYSGIGVVDGWFYPSQADLGYVNIYYSFTDENGCADVAVTTITVLASPQVTLEDFSPVCHNTVPFELFGGSPLGGTFSGEGVDENGWFDPQVSGMGTFVITYEYVSQDGCAGFDSKTITVNSVPVATISGSTTICLNGIPPVVTFSATNGEPPYTFSYEMNGGATQTISTTNGLSEVSIQFNTSQLGTSIFNLLGVEDSNGCVSTVFETATIEVIEVDVEISIEIDDVSCFGFDNGRIKINATGGTGALEYSIDNGTNFFSSPVFENLSPNTYNLIVRDEYLCAATTSATISEPDLLGITVVEVEDVYCRNEAAGGSIMVEVAGGIGNYSYSWFDQTNTPIGENSESIEGVAQGTYWVVITDPNGCTLEDSFIIGYLDEDCIVRIPQGFSPDGDGKNDVWGIRNLLYMHPDNRVRIFNRHGTLIFEAEKYDDDWDGTPNRGNVLLGHDGKVPQGVYYYMIWLEPDGKPINGYVYVSY